MNRYPTDEDRERNIFDEGLEQFWEQQDERDQNAQADKRPAEAAEDALDTAMAPSVSTQPDEDEDVRIYQPKRTWRSALSEETEPDDVTYYAEESPEETARFYVDEPAAVSAAAAEELLPASDEPVWAPEPEETENEDEPAQPPRRRGFFARLFGGVKTGNAWQEDPELADVVEYDPEAGEQSFDDEYDRYAETEEIPDEEYNGHYEEETSYADRQVIGEILDEFWKDYQDPDSRVEPIAVETSADAEAYAAEREEQSPVAQVLDVLSQLRSGEISEAEEGFTGGAEETVLSDDAALYDEEPAYREEEPSLDEQLPPEPEYEEADEEENPAYNIFDILHEYASWQPEEDEAEEAAAEQATEADSEPDEAVPAEQIPEPGDSMQSIVSSFAAWGKPAEKAPAREQAEEKAEEQPADEPAEEQMPEAAAEDTGFAWHEIVAEYRDWFAPAQDEPEPENEPVIPEAPVPETPAADEPEPVLPEEPLPAEAPEELPAEESSEAVSEETSQPDAGEKLLAALTAILAAPVMQSPVEVEGPDEEEHPAASGAEARPVEEPELPESAEAEETLSSIVAEYGDWWQTAEEPEAEEKPSMEGEPETEEEPEIEVELEPEEEPALADAAEIEGEPETVEEAEIEVELEPEEEPAFADAAEIEDEPETVEEAEIEAEFEIEDNPALADAAEKEDEPETVEEAEIEVELEPEEESAFADAAEIEDEPETVEEAEIEVELEPEEEPAFADAAEKEDEPETVEEREIEAEFEPEEEPAFADTTEIEDEPETEEEPEIEVELELEEEPITEEEPETEEAPEIDAEAVYRVEDILAEYGSWWVDEEPAEETAQAEEPAAEPEEAAEEPENLEQPEPELPEPDEAFMTTLAALTEATRPLPKAEPVPQEQKEPEEEPAGYSVHHIVAEYGSWWDNEEPEEPAADESAEEAPVAAQEEPIPEETAVDEAADQPDESLESAPEEPEDELPEETAPQAEPEQEPAEPEEPEYNVRDILEDFHSWWMPEESEPEQPELIIEEAESTPVEAPEEPAEAEPDELPEEPLEVPEEPAEPRPSAAELAWYRESEPEIEEEPAYKVHDILEDFHSWWTPEAAAALSAQPMTSEPLAEETSLPQEPELPAEPLEDEPEPESAEEFPLPEATIDTIPIEPEETDHDEPAYDVRDILEDFHSWWTPTEETAAAVPVQPVEEPAAPEAQPDESTALELPSFPERPEESEPEAEAVPPEPEEAEGEAAPDYAVGDILNEYSAWWMPQEQEETDEEEPAPVPKAPAMEAAAFSAALETIAAAPETESAANEDNMIEEETTPPREDALAVEAEAGEDYDIQDILEEYRKTKIEEEEMPKPARSEKAAPKLEPVHAAEAIGTAAAAVTAAAASSAAVSAASAAAHRSGISRMEEEARHLAALMEQGIELSEDEPEAEAPVVPEPSPVKNPFDPDDRFRFGSEQPQEMNFGGKPLDLSPDENYVPPHAESDLFHWAPGEEEAIAAEPVPEKKNPFARLLNRRKKTPVRPEPETEEAAVQEINDAADTSYAPDRDYSFDEDPVEDNPFPSFGQYLVGLVSGVLVRFRGVGGGNATATAAEDDEDLGPELAPAAASRYYGGFVHSLRLRFAVGLVLLGIMAWLTLGLPVTGMLRSVRVAAGMCLGLQLTIMLLCLDVITGAAVNLGRGRFGAAGLAAVSCVLTSFDALVVLMGTFGTPHMPLCLISSLSLMGVLLSSVLSARSLRKAMRVPAIGKRCYTVTGETDIKGKGITLLKSLRPAKGFVRRSEEAAPDETLFDRLSVLLLAAALVLSLIVALAQKAGSDLLFISSAILSPAVPVTALLCFALPYFFGTMRIFSSGAAIAGWSGLCDIGQSQNLIVTDRDLFPEGSVELDTVRIFADIPAEKVISYAGTMITASGSCLAPCFAELMSRNGGTMRAVENYEYLSGGGMKGIIDGEVVLCGSVELMRLMNVRVPYRLVGKTTVLLAVDGLLYGIFNMKYEAQPQVRRALIGLIRSNRHPVFAIRDFNVTPELLHSIFDVATDGYDFPPYVERFALSEARPTDDSKVAAVVCREGLGPLVHMADTGRSMYMATRINLLITLLCAVIGVILVFLRLLSVGTVGAGFLLLYLLVWALPVAVVSFLLRF